ncbi:MAG: exonuclease SbcCD subunit D [Defluviitaleaceae bacterium]|nr:exonuclease SbcCD subunit D [Defluviitaleaceae bacterium]
MKILHTADWHLGAYLGNFSRIDEQAIFLQQLLCITEENDIDIVIVAGDIYDTLNPSAAAESLFYNTMARLSEMKIPVVFVAGNHDSAERLGAIIPVVSELGVHIFSEPGFIEINTKGQSAVIAAMPFVSEKRLNEAIFTTGNEATMQKEYSAKVASIFENLTANFRPDATNIAVGHFHIAGGETSKGLERDILQIGGVFAVHPNDMPNNADYIAMGHLHRAQKITCGDGLAHYSGSPLPYSLSERGQPKSVNIVHISSGQNAVIEKVFLDCPKPIELWTVATAADAIEKCKQSSNAYKYIVITDEHTISTYDIKEMKRLTGSIVSIELSANEQSMSEINMESLQVLSPREEFASFYETAKGVPPTTQIIKIFDEILTQEES